TSQANVTLSNATYLITGTVSLSGATTFESGAVLKYNNIPSSSLSVANGDYGTLSFTATNYRPVIFTSKNDNTIGDQISDSTGDPGANDYGNPCLSINASAAYYPKATVLQNFRISRAQVGITINYGSGTTL